MKKHVLNPRILATAFLVGLPCVASAQTNITLTGSLDQALEWSSSDANGGKGSDLKVRDGAYAGSRVSLIGSEDIGGGVKGIFNLEHRLQPDNGAGCGGPGYVGPAAGDDKACVSSSGAAQPFWHGQAWVGLQTGGGDIRFGRQYTIMYNVLKTADLTGYSFYNNLNGLAGTSTRWNNAIEYRTPKFGGFQGYLMWGAGENAGTSRGDAYGLGLTGKLGPVELGAGFARSKLGNAAIAAAPGVAPAPAETSLLSRLPGAAGTDISQTEWGLGAAGKFGPVGVGLAFAQSKAATVKRQGLGGQVSFGMGPGTVFVSAYQDKLKNAGTANNMKDLGLGLTYRHGLSKRTFLYATLGYNKVGYEATTKSDLKAKKVALGVRHFF